MIPEDHCGNKHIDTFISIMKKCLLFIYTSIKNLLIIDSVKCDTKYYN